MYVWIEVSLIPASRRTSAVPIPTAFSSAHPGATDARGRARVMFGEPPRIQALLASNLGSMRAKVRSQAVTRLVFRRPKLFSTDRSTN